MEADTRGFAAGFAQTARAWFRQSIARGRFTAVATVLAELVFELLHPRLQLRDQCNKLGDQVDRRFFALLVNGTNLFRRW
jgi:hypothetical protein